MGVSVSNQSGSPTVDRVNLSPFTKDFRVGERQRYSDIFWKSSRGLNIKHVVGRVVEGGFLVFVSQEYSEPLSKCVGQSDIGVLAHDAIITVSCSSSGNATETHLNSIFLPLLENGELLCPALCCKQAEQPTVFSFSTHSSKFKVLCGLTLKREKDTIPFTPLHKAG
ncbi:unnamed protein product [Thelazia callipaeda]|uniref:PDZ domain-containing protein n=1 Tax=Thelazia callipaeda TaxID=103827 RepID=A0A0N5CPA4_THECL|nr:unnamed protein product [Thelazia callipaeda]